MTDETQPDVIPDEAPAVESDAPTHDDAPYYCPGCGRRWQYEAACVGMTPAAPHPPIDVVSTDELYNGSDEHTAAPDTGI